MKHPDEHTLELYVLRSESVKRQRHQIKTHLDRCEGCRSVADQFRRIYRDAENELEAKHLGQPAADTGLARIERGIIPVQEPEDGPVSVPIDQPTTLSRVYYFARQHPIVAGTGTLAFIGAAVALLSLVTSTHPRDTNPHYVFLNTAESSFQVYNQEDEKLWQIPAPPASLDAGLKAENLHTVRYSKVADLNGDGKNEVVTIVPFLGGETEKENLLCIYAPDKTIHHATEYGGPVHFRDVQYQGKFGPAGLLVEDFAGDGRQEITVAANSHRSPFVLTRYNADAMVQGEYWHFGHMAGIYAVNLDPDGKKKIVLCGVNDVNQASHERFGTIIVLDPARIQGQTESSSSRGFGLSPSGAELYYIRLPETDMAKVMQADPAFRRMSIAPFAGQDALNFLWPSTKAGEQVPPQFEYFFSKDMRLLAVKADEGTVRKYDELVREGKLTGKMDDKYLETLKQSIRYWDGKMWRKEVVRVQH